MTNTNAIDNDYRRVIGAKFSTTRKGDPITCRYCSNAIVVGRDFAAVDACSTWHNVCSVCAGSRIAQVVGLVSKVEALAATLSGPSLDALVATAQGIDTLCTQAIAGDGAAALSVTPVLLNLLANVKSAVTVTTAQADPFAAEVERLRAARPFITLAKDATFADSLVSQWDKRGFLSDKQRPYVTKLADAAEALQADQVLTPLTRAILVRVPTDDGSPRASVRVAIPSGGHNDLDFLAVFVGRVERHTGAPGDVHKQPLAAAQAKTLAERIAALSDADLLAAQALYGQAMHFCGRCGSPLTDKASRDRGLGPDCATKGWV